MTSIHVIRLVGTVEPIHERQDFDVAGRRAGGRFGTEVGVGFGTLSFPLRKNVGSQSRIGNLHASSVCGPIRMLDLLRRTALLLRSRCCGSGYPLEL